MANTTFQNTSLALQIGVPVSINLATYNSLATSFGIVNTSRAWNQSVLPPGLSMNSAGLITGTPTTAGVTVCKARAYRGTRDADASWAARSAGAYNAQRFDTATPITAGGTRISNSTWDTNIKRSGNGSLYQFIPAGSPVNTASKWEFSTRVNQTYTGAQFSFASNTGFALGEEFYIQFGIRGDRNFCQYPWGNYPKIAILDMLSWGTNLNLGPTANVWEHVVIPGFGGLYGYVNGVDGNPWNQFRTNTEGDLVYQPNVRNLSRTLNGNNPGMASGGGTTWSSLQQQRARNATLYNAYTNIGLPDGRPDPLTGGAAFAHDQWHTVLYHVRMDVAPSQTIGIKQFLSGAHLFEVEIAHEGQDYVKVFSETYPLRVGQLTGPNYFLRDSGQPNGSQATCFSGLQFTNLMFGIDMSGFPLYQTWLDEILCTSTRPAAPDFDGTGSYRTADTLLTFKVT